MAALGGTAVRAFSNWRSKETACQSEPGRLYASSSVSVFDSSLCRTRLRQTHKICLLLILSLFSQRLDDTQFSIKDQQLLWGQAKDTDAEPSYTLPGKLPEIVRNSFSYISASTLITLVCRVIPKFSLAYIPNNLPMAYKNLPMAYNNLHMAYKNLFMLVYMLIIAR